MELAGAWEEEFPLPFTVLLAGLRIILTCDRLQEKIKFNCICTGNPHRHGIPKTVRQHEAYVSSGEVLGSEDPKGRKTIRGKVRGEIGKQRCSIMQQVS